MKKLNLWQRFLLKVNGQVFTGYEKHEGWSEALAIYAVRCSKHGLYCGHLHGHHELAPDCPKCMEELTKKVLLLN